MEGYCNNTKLKISIISIRSGEGYGIASSGALRVKWHFPSVAPHFFI